MSVARTFCIACVLLLGLQLDPNDGLVRRFDVAFDGKDRRVSEGEEISLPCAHAEGKTHTLKVYRAPTYLFRGRDFSFEFDPDMRLIVDADEDSATTIVIAEHENGTLFELTTYPEPLSPDDFKSIVDEAAHSLLDDEVTLKRGAPETHGFGPTNIPGIPLTVRVVDADEEHWFGYTNRNERGYLFAMVTPGERAMPAGRMLGLIQRTFKFGSADAATSAPSSRPTDK